MSMKTAMFYVGGVGIGLIPPLLPVAYGLLSTSADMTGSVIVAVLVWFVDACLIVFCLIRRERYVKAVGLGILTSVILLVFLGLTVLAGLDARAGHP